jgi:hypothetical protein
MADDPILQRFAQLTGFGGEVPMFAWLRRFFGRSAAQATPGTLQGVWVVADAEIDGGKRPAACVLVLRTPEHALAVTVLNFGRQPLEEELDLTGVSGEAKPSPKGAAGPTC